MWDDPATTQNKVLNTHKFDALVDRHSSYTDSYTTLHPEHSYIKNITNDVDTKTVFVRLEDVEFDSLYQFAKEYNLVLKSVPYNTQTYQMYLRDNPEDTYFLIHVDNGYRTLGLRCTGEISLVNKYEAYINEYVDKGIFKKPKSRITWLINKDTTIQAVVTCSPEIKSAYPWLGISIKEYSDLFFESESNILLLIGQPGTGKSSFLKNMCLQSEKDVAVTYDKNFIESGEVYGRFFESDNDVLIIEDADTLLRKREDGNDFMATLLNMGQGIVSTPNKKLIFTVNLPTIKDIDPALIRPGRCFDILDFRYLTYDESLDVLEETGKTKELNINKSYSLAELLNEEPSYFSGKKQKITKPSSFGFG